MSALPKFIFADPATKDYFQQIVNQMKQQPKTLEAVQVIAPAIIRSALITKYQQALQDHPDAVWPQIVQEISLTILLNATQFVPAVNSIHTITIPAIVSAYTILYRPEPECILEKPVRVSGRQLKYPVAPPVTGPLPRTFLISGQSGFDHGPLREMFAGLGFTEETFESLAIKKISHVGCLFLEQSYHYNPKERLRYDTRTAQLTCNVKSILAEDKQCITNKQNLYYNLMEVAPSVAPNYLARTRKLNEVMEVLPSEVLILKPVGSSAGCGVGIQVVTTTAELQKAKFEILSAYPSGIASDYILRPLLFSGKKFHLRMYLLARSPINGSEPHVEIFPTGRILTAKENYQLSDFSNPNIHDSHIKSTAQNYFFPQDFIYCHTVTGKQYPDPSATVQHIVAQMQQIATIVGWILKSKMRKWVYPESNFGYEVFGCDFMIQAEEKLDGIESKVILLEINDKVSNRPAMGDTKLGPSWPPIEGPGIYRWNLEPYSHTPYYANLIEYTKFSALVWNWILQTGILPCYLPFESPSVPLTYLISGANGINHGPLRSILNSHGFTEVDVTSSPQRIGFICQEQKVIDGRVQYDKRVYQFTSYLKSLLDNRRYIISDKSSLYRELQKIRPDLVSQYMALTLPVSEITAVSTVLIVKPISKPGQFIGGGQDITVVTSYPELKDVETKLVQRYGIEPIASEYILDPWLIDGRKCHFRMFILIRTAGQSIHGRPVSYTCQLWDQGTVMTALKPYRMENFTDPDIHDTHLKSTDRDRYFNLTNPDSTDTGLTLDQRQTVFTQLQQIIDAVGVLMQTHTYPYTDSTYAYEVFGLDFMIRRESMSIVLLEINDHVGMKSIDSAKLPGYNPENGPWTPRYTEFSTDFWNWVYQYGIFPFFS